MLVLLLAVGQTHAALAQPGPADSEAADLWRAMCKHCHGDDGRGRTKMGPRFGVPDLTQPSTQRCRTDEALKAVIAEGTGGTKMKSFRHRVSDAELRELVAFIRQMAGSEPAVAQAPPSCRSVSTSQRAGHAARGGVQETPTPCREEAELKPAPDPAAEDRALQLLSEARLAFAFGDFELARAVLVQAQRSGWNDLDLSSQLGMTAVDLSDGRASPAMEDNDLKEPVLLTVSVEPPEGWSVLLPLHVAALSDVEFDITFRPTSHARFDAVLIAHAHNETLTVPLRAAPVTPRAPRAAPTSDRHRLRCRKRTRER